MRCAAPHRIGIGQGQYRPKGNLCSIPIALLQAIISLFRQITIQGRVLLTPFCRPVKEPINGLFRLLQATGLHRPLMPCEELSELAIGVKLLLLAPEPHEWTSLHRDDLEPT